MARVERSRRRAGRGPLSAVLGLALAAAALAGPALTGPALAADPPREGLSLQGARLGTDRSLSLLATVPDVLSGQDLPSSAFTATQGGAPVPLTAMRAVGGAVPVELVVALDAPADPLVRAQLQTAAADLLRAFPAETPTTVLPDGQRTSARSALAALGDAGGPAQGDLLAELPAAPPVPRFLVVLATCPALQAARHPVTDPQTQVSVLATGGTCDDAAARLAAGPRGVLRTGLDATGLLAGVDAATRAATGTWVLQTGPGAGPGPLTVTVASGSVTATATSTPPAPAVVAARPRAGHSRTVPATAAAVLALMAAGVLALRLRQRPRTA